MTFGRFFADEHKKCRENHPFSTFILVIHGTHSNRNDDTFSNLDFSLGIASFLMHSAIVQSLSKSCATI